MQVNTGVWGNFRQRFTCENNLVKSLHSFPDFILGKAEYILPELLKKEMASPEDPKGHQRVVAIVDPPRAGLHPKAVTALRAAADIKTLVYVSCDAKAAMQVWIIGTSLQ